MNEIDRDIQTFGRLNRIQVKGEKSVPAVGTDECRVIAIDDEFNENVLRK
jgi:hypothetical protein